MIGASRQTWIDVAKGVGIVLVVIGHVMVGLFTSGILDRVGVAATVVYGIYIFHMPLFFFLAGVTLPRSLEKGPSAFVRAKAYSILWPYLIWSIIQGSAQLAVASDLNYGFQASDLLNITWKPIGHFWFLYALLICHAVALIASRLRVPLLAFAVAGLLAYPILPALLSLTAFNLAFYAAGAACSDRIMRWSPRYDAKWTGLAAAASLFVLAAVGSGIASDWVWLSLAAVPASFAGILTVVWLSKIVEDGMARLAAAAGAMSLSIYVMHIIASSGTRVLLSKNGVADPIVHLISGVAAGVLIPIAAHLVLARLRLLAPLGLGLHAAKPERRAAAASMTSQY